MGGSLCALVCCGLHGLWAKQCFLSGYSLSLRMTQPLRGQYRCGCMVLCCRAIFCLFAIISFVRNVFVTTVSLIPGLSLEHRIEGLCCVKFGCIIPPVEWLLDWYLLVVVGGFKVVELSLRIVKLSLSDRSNGSSLFNSSGPV